MMRSKSSALSITIISLLMLSSLMIFIPNETKIAPAHILAGVTHHWNVSASGFASNAGNWVEGTVPGAGDDIVFAQGGDCIWDVANTVFGTFNMTPTYTHHVIILTNIHTSGPVHIQGGLLSGGSDYWYSQNDFIVSSSAHLAANSVSLDVSSSAGHTIDVPYNLVSGNGTLHALQISQNTHISNLAVRYGVAISAIINLTGNLVVYLESATPYSNTGSIIGSGNLTFLWTLASNRAMVFGSISCPTVFNTKSPGSSATWVRLGANTTFGSSLNINSTYNYPLIVWGDLANYGLTVRGLLTLGNYARIIQSSSFYNLTGGIKISGNSAVYDGFSSGGYLNTSDMEMRRGLFNATGGRVDALSVHNYYTSNSVIFPEYYLTSTDTTVIFADDFEHDTFVPMHKGGYLANAGTLYPSGSAQGMVVGDDAYHNNYSLDYWNVSSYRHHSGNYSLWCAQDGLASWAYNNSTANSVIHRIDQEMNCYYENYIDLSLYDRITLSFWYWIQSSAPSGGVGTFKTSTGWGSDALVAEVFNGTAFHYLFATGGNHTWTHVTLNIPTSNKLIGFYYLRSLANRTLFEGAYIDDIVLTGHKKPQSSIPIGDSYLFNLSVRSPSVGLNHFTLTTNASWLSISSSNATEATISGTPTHEGLYTVSLKVNDSFSATWKNWTVEVYFVLDHVDVSPASISLVAGSQAQFTANGKDVYNNNAMSGLTFTWTTNVGSVTSSGLFTADTTAGVSGFVNASTGGKIGTAGITIVPDQLTHIVVSPVTVAVIAGATQSFTAVGYDQYNNVIPGLTFTWTTNIGTMTGSSLTAQNVAGASGYVRAASGVVNGSASVTIVPGALDHINLSPTGPLSVVVGSQTQFSAIGMDVYNNAISGLTFTWMTTVGGVTSGGLFTAQTTAGASGYVNASIGFVKGSAGVTIVPDQLNHIVVMAATIDVVAGTVQNFSAVGYDRYNNAIPGVTFTWTTNVGTMAGNHLTAQTTGTTGRVRATSGFVFGDSSVTVVPAALDHIDIFPSSLLNCVAGTQHQFTVTGRDVYNNTISGLAVNWTTDVGGIGSSGLFTAQTTAGESGYVNASTGGKTVTVNVTIIPDQLTHIVVTPITANVTAGATQVFTAVGYDQYNNAIPDLVFTWTTNVGVMTGNSLTAQMGYWTTGYARASNGLVFGGASASIQPRILDFFLDALLVVLVMVAIYLFINLWSKGSKKLPVKNIKGAKTTTSKASSQKKRKGKGT
jgi:hypothetical protein